MKLTSLFAALVLSALAFSFTACEESIPPVDKLDVDKILPAILHSAVVKNSNPSAIVLTFDKPMNIDNYQSWTVQGSGAALEFDKQKFPGGYGTNVITMHLKGAVRQGDSIKLTYGGMNAPSPNNGTVRSIDNMPLLAIPLLYANNQVGECWNISFEAQAGGSNPPNDMSVSKGSKVTLPGRSGTIHSDPQKVFEGWSETQTGSIISNWWEYQPSGDIVLYAKWNNMETVVGAVHETFVDGFVYKMGDANKNTGIAWDISVLVSLLERAQEGYDKEVKMPLADGSTKTVLVPEYNLTLVADWSRTLDELIDRLDNKPPVIFVKEMRFMYRAPTASVREPVYRVGIAHAGDYLIELKGGAGGHVRTNGGQTTTGGKGGYVSGIFHIDADTELAFRIGGIGYGSSYYDAAAFQYALTDYPKTAYFANGSSMTMTTFATAHAGGYNGGGNGGAAPIGTHRAGSGGGGATDVQLYQEPRNLTGDPSTDSRFIVAGGGGGAAQAEGAVTALGGGDAGGLTGVSGNGKLSAPPRAGAQTALGGTVPAGTVDGLAGVGTSGVNGANPNDGSHLEGRGGGGGGWFGGGAQTVRTQKTVYTGAGGSSYVMDAGSSKGGVTKTNAEPGNETNPKQEYANGWARIIWVDQVK